MLHLHGHHPPRHQPTAENVRANLAEAVELAGELLPHLVPFELTHVLSQSALLLVLLDQYAKRVQAAGATLDRSRKRVAAAKLARELRGLPIVEGTGTYGSDA